MQPRTLWFELLSTLALTHSYPESLQGCCVFCNRCYQHHPALSNTESVCMSVSPSYRDCANLDFSVLLSDSEDGRLANRDIGKNCICQSLFLLSFINSEMFHFCFAQRHFVSGWQSRKETLESFLELLFFFKWLDFGLFVCLGSCLLILNCHLKVAVLFSFSWMPFAAQCQ